MSNKTDEKKPPAKPTFNNADEFYQEFQDEFKRLPLVLQKQLIYMHLENESRNKTKHELDEIIKHSHNRVDRMRAKLQKKLFDKKLNEKKLND